MSTGYTLRHVIEVGEDTRIHELMLVNDRLFLQTYNTWGKLFNTEDYRRRVALKKRVMKHVHWFIGKTMDRLKAKRGVDVATWSIYWDKSRKSFRIEALSYNKDEDDGSTAC